MAIEIEHLTYRFGERVALDDLSLSVQAGEVFHILGPNGGGKTTLFRILSTLVPPQTGRAAILGCDVVRQTIEVRSRLGVVFQSPSLDRQLTVRENLEQQAVLYGLPRAERKVRMDELLEQLGLNDRAGDRVEILSGGLRRRVELAKALLHRPQVMLLDEPTVGLDPAVRADFWRFLFQWRDQFGITVLATTHLLEEAERADRIAILDRGRLVGLGSARELREQIGGDSLTIEGDDPRQIAQGLEERFGLKARLVDGRVRLEHPEAAEWVGTILRTWPGQVRAVTVGRPTLEDVFIARTGHRFWGEHENGGVQ